MVIFPDSMATAAGLTFIIGQITWTTGSNDLVIAARGGGADPICINYFPDTGIDYDYAGSNFACTSALIDYAGNSSTPPSLPGEETRLH
jgi:hypothetical protein